jgi:tRNA/rRNA methyltransferase
MTDDFSKESSTMSLHRCRIVLVRSKFAANIGAVARVMRNMGLSDLVLVAPQADLADRNARQLSTHGESILDRARVVSELSDALADCIMVAATSARVGKLIRGRFRSPEEIVPRLVASAAQGPVALVFGPETSGLTDEEVARLHHLIHVPAEPAYPALNLAQAAAICIYELRKAWLSQDGQPTDAPPPASFGEQERLFGELRQALEDIHFVYGPKGDVLMHGLRQLISRAQPTAMEIGLLFGLARQIRWYASHHKGPGLGDTCIEPLAPLSGNAGEVHLDRLRSACHETDERDGPPPAPGRSAPATG